MIQRLRRPTHVLFFLLAVLLLAGCAGSERATRDTSAAADTSVTPAATAPPPTVPATVPTRATVPISEADTIGVTPGRFDLGKMWTFDYPPTAYFREEYGLELGPEWFERARLGALRFATYCSASFVSPNGLIMTNHHCARASVTQVSEAGENLLDEGFYARELGDERPVPGLFVDQLIAIQDVTDEVNASLAGLQSNEERAQARSEAIARITERLAEAAGGMAAGVHVQVISLYQGARYSAYTFRRYSDVRLVMAPEHQVAYFGGDYDNFTYPRYSLDMAFFRAYDDEGEPLTTEHYFRWSTTGLEEGDVVFVVGNPGSTSRLETVAQLEYRRDVTEPAILGYYQDAIAALEAYYEEHPSEDQIRTSILQLMNAEKVYTGRLRGLRDERLIERRRAGEEEFVAAIRSNPALSGEYGGLVDELAAIQEERKQMAAEFRAFLALGPTSAYTSATLRRGLIASDFLTHQQESPSEEAISQLQSALEQVVDQPVDLDERFLAARLRTFQEAFGDTSQLVRDALEGRTPEAQARQVIDNTTLRDVDATIRAVRAGNLTPQNDAALRLVQAFLPRYRSYQTAVAALELREAEILSRLGRARFEVSGTEVPPDATFSLRIADGVVMGYPYNGTYAPHETTYNGMYDRHYSFESFMDEWDLPERWLEAPASFDLDTPLNLVSTNDIIGGNSGSPLLNSNLEVVGLVFDGNIESLPGAYIYLTETARAVSVHAQGMIEALDDIYDMDRIVLELTSGRLVETEEDADEIQAGQ